MVPSEYVKKSRAAIEGNNYAVKVTINRDKDSADYGKVIGIEFGMNKKTGQPYTTEEARQLLLVSCARKNQGLAKTDKESFLDLVLTHPEYYTSEGCSVRLPQFKDEATQKDIENTIKSCTEKSLKDASDIMIPIAIKTPKSEYHMCVVVATKKDNKVNFKIFDPSKALKLEDRERVKQIFGDYIYDNLDKENYILSPNKAIQDELTKKSQLFKGTCTGISTEYINYMIDTKQKAKKLTEQQGEEIQERYTSDIVENTLHHAVLKELQKKQQTVKQKTELQETPSVKEKKTAIEDNLVKKYSNRPINIPTLPRPPKKKTIPESKPVIESKQVKQDKVVDKDEVKPEAIPVKNTDIDKKPIKEEITVRNALVEKSKQYFIKTEFANGKLNMSLIEYKTEEHNKDFAKFYNDNHILFTKGANGYGCLFEEDMANKIINDNATTNRYNNIFIYTDNKYVSKNEYMQKKKEEEQKRQEEEQKKKGSSSMESLKNIDKDNQVKEASKESSGLLSNLRKYFSKKSTDNEKQTLLNTPEEQKPSKSSWWSGKKKKTTEKCK